MQGAYNAAEGTQAGADSALATLLKQGGAEGAQNLAAKLGPGGAEAAAGAGAIGSGAAAASYGTGSADLTKLLQSGTASADYGARCPASRRLPGSRTRSLRRRRSPRSGRTRSASCSPARRAT